MWELVASLFPVGVRGVLAEGLGYVLVRSSLGGKLATVHSYLF